MELAVERKFAVEIAYNGVAKKFEVERHELVGTLLRHAIAAFGIVQNPHLLGLFRMDGTELQDNQTLEAAGLKPCEEVLLRPSAVRGGANTTTLAAGVVEATLRVFRECGQGECECVAYWVSDHSSNIVDGVVHPVHERSAFGYEVNAAWLTEFWKELAVAKRSIKAQVHTHPASAFHSSSDDKWPIVSQPGFLSIVIPDFAMEELSLERAWIGILMPDGRWQRIRSLAEGGIVA